MGHWTKTHITLYLVVFSNGCIQETKLSKKIPKFQLLGLDYVYDSRKLPTDRLCGNVFRDAFLQRFDFGQEYSHAKTHLKNKSSVSYFCSNERKYPHGKTRLLLYCISDGDIRIYFMFLHHFYLLWQKTTINFVNFQNPDHSTNNTVQQVVKIWNSGNSKRFCCVYEDDAEDIHTFYVSGFKVSDAISNARLFDFLKVEYNRKLIWTWLDSRKEDGNGDLGIFPLKLVKE